MTFREKVIAAFLLLTLFLALGWWITAAYRAVTIPLPKNGGHYSEGMVGQPLYINPLISQTSQIDADLTQLIYSALFTYDTTGIPVAHLAERYDLSEDKKTYTVFLRENIQWHDGQPLTADDVIFTFTLLKDPAFKRPLRHNWQGVAVAKQEDRTVTFTLKNPYSGFIHNLTVGILPKHIWESITSETFTLAERNLSPIGSGPYQFGDLQKDSAGNIVSYELRASRTYFLGEPHISKMTFHFYPDEETLIAAYNKKEIMGIHNVLPRSSDAIAPERSTAFYELHVPRYFAIFLNRSKSVPLAAREVREALSAATDRSTIVDIILKQRGSALRSPFTSFMDGYADDRQQPDFDRERANRILDENGWERKEDGIRQKNDVRLSFTITTADWPELTDTAALLKEQWQEIGAAVEIQALSITDLQQNEIRPREYDALLFGQVTHFFPDPYFFWHSSQKLDPGLNLAVLNHKDVDATLDQLRLEHDQERRRALYGDFQKFLAEDVPAIFLYSPSYVYVMTTKVKGVTLNNINAPQYRFAHVHEWYLKTRRVMK